MRIYLGERKQHLKMPLQTCFRRPAIPASKLARLIASANKAAGGGVLIDTAVSEFCFYIEGGASTATLDDKVLSWLLSETYEPADFAAVTFFDEVSK